MTTGDFYPPGSGQQPPPMNAPRAVPLSVGVQPGTPNIIRARQILVLGPNDGVFIYDATGAIVGAWVGRVTKDPVDGYSATAGLTVLTAGGAALSVLSSTGLDMRKVSGALAPPRILLTDTTIAAPNFTQLTPTAINTPDVNGFQPGTNTVETWHTMTLAAGWSNVAGYAPASYRLNALGNVELAGRISGTITGTTTVSTLPSGYFSVNFSKAYSVNVDSAGAGLTPNLTPHLGLDTTGLLTVTGINNGSAIVDLTGTFMISVG